MFARALMIPLSAATARPVLIHEGPLKNLLWGPTCSALICPFEKSSAGFASDLQCHTLDPNTAVIWATLFRWKVANTPVVLANQ